MKLNASVKRIFLGYCLSLIAHCIKAVLATNDVNLMYLMYLMNVDKLNFILIKYRFYSSFLPCQSTLTNVSFCRNIWFQKQKAASRLQEQLPGNFNRLKLYLCSFKTKQTEMKIENVF